MNATLGTRDMEQFQRAIERRLGLRFDDHRVTHLAEVLGFAQISGASRFLKKEFGVSALAMRRIGAIGTSRRASAA